MTHALTRVRVAQPGALVAPSALGRKLTALTLPGIAAFDVIGGRAYSAAAPAVLSGGLGRAADVSTAYTSDVTIPAITAYPLVLVWVGRFNSAGASWTGSALRHASDNSGNLCRLRVASSSAAQWVMRNNYGTTVQLAVSVPGGTAVGVDMVLVGISRSATDHAIYCRTASGVARADSTTSVGAISGSWTGHRWAGDNNGHRTYVAGGGNQPLTDAEIAEILANPWCLFSPMRRGVLVQGVAAGGGATVAVPVASATLTAYAPAVLAPRAVAVPAGTLTLTSYAPTVAVSANRIISVPLAALALTAYAPAVVAPRTVAVPAGALALAAFAPSVSVTSGTAVQVPAAAMSLTAFAPTVALTAHQRVAVPAGALLVTAYAPTVSDGSAATAPRGRRVRRVRPPEQPPEQPPESAPQPPQFLAPGRLLMPQAGQIAAYHGQQAQILERTARTKRRAAIEQDDERAIEAALMAWFE